MSMRSQLYEWDGSRDTAIGSGQAGQRISIFIGGFGNNITKPAETTATQFVVIEDVAELHLHLTPQLQLLIIEVLEPPTV